MRKILSIVGYILIASTTFLLLLDLLPNDVVGEIILWIFSIFYGGDNNHIYFKVVSSESNINPISIVFVIGVLFVLLAKYIDRKKNGA